MSAVIPSDPTLVLPALAFFAVAALYASVGHGGASAYLALMALTGFAPAEMKPVALTLNIAVSCLALVMFVHAGHFRMGLFLPLAVASIPSAFAGGCLDAPVPVFKLILGAALLAGAVRLLIDLKDSREREHPPHVAILLALGGALGFLSGLIGVGGGIFLTPILILFRWSPAKTAAAVSAAFILANSLSGLSGYLFGGHGLPPVTWSLLPAVLAGGLLGSLWGAHRAATPGLRGSLAAVLVIAAAKFAII